MIQDNSDLWNNLQSSDIFASWGLQPIKAIREKQGLIDNMPFLDFIQQIIANFDKFYRKITVSALNVNEGVIEYFTDANTPKDEFYKAAFSSTCIPGAFPNYHWVRKERRQKLK